jgi:hypothetical protein
MISRYCTLWYQQNATVPDGWCHDCSLTLDAAKDRGAVNGDWLGGDHFGVRGGIQQNPNAGVNMIEISR